MAITPLDHDQLDQYLASAVSKNTERSIYNALHAEGQYPPNDSTSIDVDEDVQAGVPGTFVTEPSSVKLDVIEGTGSMEINSSAPLVTGMGNGNDNVYLLSTPSGKGDTLIAGNGTDILNDLTSGNDEMIGGRGPDTIHAGTGKDTLIGGSGQNHLYAYNGGAYDGVPGSGGPGSNAPTTSHASINGGAGSSTIYGGLVSQATDTLVGGTGADLMSVRMGNNYLHGGSKTSSDTMYAGSGSDTLIGGLGHNVLYGYAGSGSDTVSTALLNGGSGQSTLYGGRVAGAQDTLQAGSGSDLLSVKEGNNVLIGGSGSSTLQGGSGADYMTGGKTSLMTAGQNGSTLTSGTFTGTKDTMNGGNGNDEFYVQNVRNGMFTVSGGGGSNTLLLSGSQKDATTTTSGNTTTISFKSTGEVVTVTGVQTIEYGQSKPMMPGGHTSA